MSPSLYGNIRMAIATLKAAKLRSFLTMLGVIIGVVSVIMIVGIGEGIKGQVSREIDQLGQDIITVRAGQAVSEGGGTFDGLRTLGSGVVPSGSLQRQDVEVVQRTSGVSQAIPVGLVTGGVQVDGRLANGQPVLMASDAALGDLLRDPLEYGEFFGSGDDLAEQPNVAVIGQDTANRLFGERSPLGSSFRLLDQTFFVRGVFKRYDATPLSSTTNFNDTIVIPYQTAQSLTNNNVNIFQILAKPADPNRLGQVAAAIDGQLDKSRQGQQQFAVLRQDQNLAFTDEILSLLTLLIAGVAAVALLVGGIGIMDVMLVSVAERMHEIGLRKALGASNRQIAVQFLTESTVLSLAGGVIGVVISLLLAFAMQVTTPITPLIPWWVVVVSMAVTLVVGIVFGTLPALKAARKDPIEALRSQ